MRFPVIPAALAATLILAGCGSDSSPRGEDGSGEAGGQSLTVVAGFYPLEYAVQEVGGDAIEVVSLTSPGVDPHALELTPRDVAQVGSADLVVYLSQMQDVVDDAVQQQAGDHAFDVTEFADLAVTGAGGSEAPEEHADEHGHEDHADEHTDEHSDEHADDHTDEQNDEHGHDHGPEDPHFWLDPERYAAVVDEIAVRLSELDPDNAEGFRERADAFIAELDEIDRAYADGLAQCTQEAVVTTHAAFGYLTDKHGLRQVAMTGSTPESEPTPARLAEIVRVVEENDVDTIYSEILAGSQWAESVASETGVQVLVLDPIEGITERSPGEDYREVMWANLENLRQGQGCS